VLEVDDDGCGFDPARATGTGQGLRNLRERAAAVGGRAEIDSVPGEGTKVRITIPR
jgi:signal transduction histidine kinase